MSPQKSYAGNSKAAALARTLPVPQPEHCPPVPEVPAGRMQVLIEAQRNYGNRAVRRMLANLPAKRRSGCSGNCATCTMAFDEEKTGG